MYTQPMLIWGATLFTVHVSTLCRRELWEKVILISTVVPCHLGGEELSKWSGAKWRGMPPTDLSIGENGQVSRLHLTVFLLQLIYVVEWPTNLSDLVFVCFWLDWLGGWQAGWLAGSNPPRYRSKASFGGRSIPAATIKLKIPGVRPRLRVLWTAAGWARLRGHLTLSLRPFFFVCVVLGSAKITGLSTNLNFISLVWVISGMTSLLFTVVFCSSQAFDKFSFCSCI